MKCREHPFQADRMINQEEYWFFAKRLLRAGHLTNAFLSLSCSHGETDSPFHRSESGDQMCPLLARFASQLPSDRARLGAGPSHSTAQLFCASGLGGLWLHPDVEPEF